MNMFGLEGSGFIIAISITLLAAGLVIYYCNNRFAAIEKVVQRQGQVVGTWLAEVKESLSGGAQLQQQGHVPSGPVSSDATPEAVAAAERYNAGPPADKIEVSDDSEEESDDDDDDSSDSASQSDDDSEAPFVANANNDVGGVKVVDVDLQDLTEVVDVAENSQIKSVIVAEEIDIESLNDDEDDDSDDEDEDDDSEEDDDDSDDDNSSMEVQSSPTLEAEQIVLTKDDDSSSVNLGEVDELPSLEVVDACCVPKAEEKAASVSSSSATGKKFSKFKKNALIDMVVERGIHDAESAKKLKVAELKAALVSHESQASSAAN